MMEATISGPCVGCASGMEFKVREPQDLRQATICRSCGTINRLSVRRADVRHLGNGHAELSLSGVQVTMEGRFVMPTGDSTWA